MSKQITSKRKKAQRMTTAVFLALLLGMIYPAALSPVNAQTQNRATASSQEGGPKEGIKVHGHWTIEVRNPDGTLVTYRDFENALEVSGAALLAQFLGRQQTAGAWRVILTDVGTNHACSDSVGPLPCTVAEIGNLSPDQGFFKTLTVSVPTQGPNANKLVLSGNATAQRVGAIAKVITQNFACTPSLSPTACGSDFLSGRLNGSMTSTTDFTPVTLSVGQIIQVTVVISFS